MLDLKSKIRQRRSQMLIHSYLYYDMDSAIVDDNKWQSWANELRDLQQTLTDMDGHCNIDFYDYAFKDWDGSTGYHLPKTVWVKEHAERLLQQHEKFSKC